MKNVKGLYSFVEGSKWFDYLKNVILNPSIWNILEDGNKMADDLLDELIIKLQNNEYTITIDAYAIEFLDKDGNIVVRIWISNYPFSYGYAYTHSYTGPLGIVKYENPTRYARILFRRFEEYVKNQTNYGHEKEPLGVESFLKIVRS